MPKPGYKTITISEKVYNKFLEFSKKNQVAGVNSFSGYITYLLESKMAKDKTFAKYAPKLELISIEEDRVIIKNKIKNRIAEIVYQRDELYCQLCEAKDCHCIGYAWSIPEIYEKLNSRGIRNNR
jgi:predicted CopG family antitoxin